MRSTDDVVAANRGLSTSRIRVKRKDDFASGASQQPHLPLCQRRSHRSDDVVETMLVRRDSVHVALNDYGSPLAPDSAGRSVKGVEQATLVEDRRLRRVDVFRAANVAIIKRTGTETSRTTLIVADREHEASPEPIVETGFDLNEKTRAQQLLIFEPDAA